MTILTVVFILYILYYFQILSQHHSFSCIVFPHYHHYAWFHITLHLYSSLSVTRIFVDFMLAFVNLIFHYNAQIHLSFISSLLINI